MSKWIENKGNDCPVPPETRVEVKLGDGETVAGIQAGNWAWSRWDGDVTEDEGNYADGIIVAYRAIDEP